jgi:pilus assembly protein Flp/PilA
MKYFYIMSLKRKDWCIMKNKLMALLKDDAGQAMTEYGLIIALVAVAVIVTLGLLGGKISDLFNGVTGKITVPA